MDSEVSLGLNQCRITFGTALECIEPAGLLIRPGNHIYINISKNMVSWPLLVNRTLLRDSKKNARKKKDMKQKFFDDKQFEFVFYYLMLVSAGRQTRGKTSH